jgi:hypothetical protein
MVGGSQGEFGQPRLTAANPTVSGQPVTPQKENGARRRRSLKPILTISQFVLQVPPITGLIRFLPPKI